MTMQDLWPSLQRNERAIIALLLMVYSFGFLAFYPRAITNIDEIYYLRQASMYSTGQTSVEKEDPVSGEMIEVKPADYPIGTALVMIPFVAAFGWKGGFLPSFIGFLLAVWVTARWLREEGRHPLFASVLLGFPPLLVYGRTATSDTVSLIPVIMGLYCFWRGQDRGAGWWLCSGFLAGASICWRESNVLLFAVFFLGSLIRRDPKTWALIISGLVGISLRPLTAWIAFGDPFFVKYVTPFSFDAALSAAPRYFVALMVFVPLGLAAALDYRGRRAIELRITVVLEFCFYTAYGYSGLQSGFAKSLILGLRFFIPLLPILALAMAEAIPRWWSSLEPRLGVARAQRMAGIGTLTWLIGLAVASTSVHVYLYNWSEDHARVWNGIDAHVDKEAVMVCNLEGIEKYFNRFEYHYEPVDMLYSDIDDIRGVLDRYAEFYLVLLDRSDSAFWREKSVENAKLAATLDPHLTLLFEDEVSSSMTLRIWKASRNDRGSIGAEARL